MVSDELPGRLEALVDYLRSRKEHHVSLGEIASVTEVLIATMSTYFKAIDTSIYREFRYLTDYINRARSEISQLHPTELKTRQIPRAGRELDAIVAATEEATNTIMEAAETIMAADPSDADEYAKTVNDSVMSIFEACSFQDITGQRISKVVETLSVIEDRLNRLGDMWGAENAEPADEAAEPEEQDDPGVSGPALAGEGIDQDGIDALLSDTAETAEADPEAEENSQEESPAADETAFEAEPAEDVSEADEPEVAEPEIAEPATLHAEWQAPAYAERPETKLSDDDIDRLMGTGEDEGPANDLQPAPVPDSRTADQLTRAVEALLQEEVGESSDAEEGRLDEQEAETADEESYAAREATNDEPATFARPATKSGSQASGGKTRTTQADIDALFS